MQKYDDLSSEKAVEEDANAEVVTLLRGGDKFERLEDRGTIRNYVEPRRLEISKTDQVHELQGKRRIVV